MFAQRKLAESGKDSEFCEKFAKQKDFPSQIKVTIEALIDIAPFDVQCEIKNSTTSSSLRKVADHLLTNKSFYDYLKAWETYSKSIAYAENDSRELPLAYANRSVVMYQLRKYEECIKDIDRAIRLNYPGSLKINLLKRKAKCLKSLGKSEEADDTCQEAIKCLENMQLTDKKKEDLVRQIQLVTEVGERVVQSNERRPLPKIVPNSKIPCASTAIDIAHNSDFGKHLVATRDIDVGEILVIEKPFALLLNPEHIYTHCSHCFARAWSSIPCPNCVHAMYCSESCRDEAWKQYHDIECPVKGYFLSMEMNDLVPFSLRLAVLAVREAGSFAKLNEELNKIDDFKGLENSWLKCFSDGVYRSDTYKAIYCLETNIGKRDWDEFFNMMLNSATIVYFTHMHTSFFEKSVGKCTEKLSESEEVMLVAKLIVHHIMLIQSNDHGFTEIDPNGQGQNVGAAMYAFCSLFNHSCDPNVTRIPVLENGNKPQQIIFAIHPIKKGSQIFDDYGFDYADAPLSTRITRCGAYHFICKCKACTDNWPEYKELKSLPSEKQRKLKKLLNNFRHYQNTILTDFQFIDSEGESYIPKLTEIVTTLYNLNLQPNKELYESVMLLRDIFSLLYGNRIGFVKENSRY